MAKIEKAAKGDIGLFRELDENTFQQIALTPEQHELLQIFLAQLSKDSPLVVMGEEYDLVLKYD